MVRIIEHTLNQTATYWAPGVPDGFGGITWGPPQQLRCRWQQKQQLVRAKAGDERVSQAVVYMTQPIDLGGRLYLGSTAELDPTTLQSYEPMAVEQAVGLDGSAVYWKVWL